MVVSAKTFSLETGFPLKLIRRLCRTGILEHWLSGRVYLLDRDKALTQMQMLRAQPVYKPQRTRRRNVKKFSTEYTSGTAYLKARLKMRKTAGAATPTVNG